MNKQHFFIWVVLIFLLTSCVSPSQNTGASPTSDLTYAEYTASGSLMGMYDAGGKAISDASNFERNLPVLTSPNLVNVSQLGRLTAARYDPSSKTVTLIGLPGTNDNQGRNDLLAALKTIFSNQEPGVSIDPGPSQTTQNIRYIGPTKGTHFGMVMLEADRLMKNMSLGQDNITGAAVTSKVAGHKTMFDLSCENPNENSQESRHRFWIVVDKMIVSQTDDGMGITFHGVKMKVNTEYLDENWQPVANPPIDPASEAFAAQLTDHYSEYADEFPVFAELESLARWVALARWLKNLNIPEVNGLQALQADVYDTPETTPAITLTQSCPSAGNVQYKFTLWGGVNLTFENTYTKANKAEEQHINGKLTENETEGWVRLSPVIQGYSTSLDLQETNIKVGETGAAFNVSYTSSQTSLPTFSDGWMLVTPRLEFPNLNTLEGDEQYSSIEWMDPGSGQRYTLTNAGQLKSTGQYAYASQEAGLILIRAAGGYTLQKATFTNDGSFLIDSSYQQSFLPNGTITTWTQSGLGTITFTYSENHLVTITSPEKTISFNFDSTGRLADITNQATSKGYHFNFNAQGLLETVTTLDNSVLSRFFYDDNRRLVEEQDGVGKTIRQAAYDNEGRLLAQKIGSEVYTYSWGSDKIRIYHLGPDANPWLEQYGTAELRNLGAIMQLEENENKDNLLYIRKSGDGARLLFKGMAYTLSKDTLDNPKALKRFISDIMPKVNDHKLNVVVNIDGLKINFDTLFPESNWINSYSLDTPQIMDNLDQIKTIPVLSPENTSIIVGIPRPDQLEATGLPTENSGAWTGVLEETVSIVQKSKYNPILPGEGRNLAQEIESALGKKDAVIIIMAHANEERIFLPNNTSFSPDEMDEAARAAMRSNRPIFIESFCKGAKVSDSASLAKKLLDLGARLVVAAPDNISALDANDFLESMLQYSNKNYNFLDALRESLKRTRIRLQPIIGNNPYSLSTRS